MLSDTIILAGLFCNGCRIHVHLDYLEIHSKEKHKLTKHETIDLRLVENKDLAISLNIPIAITATKSASWFQKPISWI